MSKSTREIIQEIRASLDELKQKERDIAIERRVLESLLLKIEGGEPVSLSPAEPRTPGRPKRTAAMVEEVLRLLANGRDWHAPDILKTLQTNLGHRVPESTLRTTLQSDSRFVKIGRGTYRLATKENDDQPAAD